MKDIPSFDSDLLLACQSALLIKITRGAPLTEVLESLCHMFERNVEGSICSILLLEPDGIHMRHGASPSLPKEYIQAVDGIAIGPKTGSCGTAVYRGDSVFVSDIRHDPLWHDYCAIALKFNLLACGSVPIFGLKNEILGTFAVYYREPHSFFTAEIEFLRSISGFASIAIDNNRREEQLRLFKAALEHATDSILITSSELDFPGPKVIHANPAFTQMTGYDAYEVIGQTPRLLQGPKTNRRVLEKLRHDLQLGRHFTGELINYRKDGSEFDVGLDITPIRDDVGNTTHFVAIQHDITEQKRSEQEKTKNIASREESLAFLSHELKNPLTALATSSELIQRAPDEDQKLALMKKLYFTVQSSVDQMLHLTTDLLNRQKAESTRIAINLSHVKVSDLLNTVFQMVSPLAEKKSIQLEKYISQDSHQVLCDRDKILQVLSNLMGNAIKFTEQGGKVSIRSERVEGKIQFQVEDTGPGIPSDQLNSIFEKFWQAKYLEHMGSGLGLYISKQIIEAHGSQISVKTRLKVGTSFSFFLQVLNAESTL